MGCSREAREFLGFPARFDGGRYDVGHMVLIAYGNWQAAGNCPTSKEAIMRYNNPIVVCSLLSFLEVLAAQARNSIFMLSMPSRFCIASPGKVLLDWSTDA